MIGSITLAAMGYSEKKNPPRGRVWWYVLQVPFLVGIPAVFLWAAIDTGKPELIGAGMVMGFIFAFSFTYALSGLIDRTRLLLSWLRSRKEAKAGDESKSLTIGSSSRKLTKPSRSLWRSQ